MIIFIISLFSTFKITHKLLTLGLYKYFSFDVGKQNLYLARPIINIKHYPSQFGSNSRRPFAGFYAA